MTTIHQTREAWLTAAVGLLSSRIESVINHEMSVADFDLAFPGFAPITGPQLPVVPRNLRVACSNPSGGIRNRVRGQCVPPSVSRDNTWEIWISPKLDNAPTVLLVLLHELIHATLGSWSPGAGHGARFWRLAKPLGFDRPLTTATIATSTPPGRNLASRLVQWADDLGDYPHAGVDFAALDQRRRRQTTRMLKAECLCGCGFKVRVTRTWAQRATPLCPVCEGLGIHSRTVVVMAEGDAGATEIALNSRLVPLELYAADVFGLCRLAGMDVGPDGLDDAEAVERAAVLRAEREERLRRAHEAAEEAAAEAARVARREAAARQAAGEGRGSARASELAATADLGVVEGQGVQNRYGADEATRERRAAERAARPVAAFEGVAPGTATVRHLIGLAWPGVGAGTDLNDVEDAVRTYCDRNGIRPPARFPLAEAWRALDDGLDVVLVHEAPAETPPRAARSARFANLDFD